MFRAFRGLPPKPLELKFAPIISLATFASPTRFSVTNSSFLDHGTHNFRENSPTCLILRRRLLKRCFTIACIMLKRSRRTKIAKLIRSIHSNWVPIKICDLILPSEISLPATYVDKINDSGSTEPSKSIRVTSYALIIPAPGVVLYWESPQRLTRRGAVANGWG